MELTGGFGAGAEGGGGGGVVAQPARMIPAIKARLRRYWDKQAMGKGKANGLSSNSIFKRISSCEGLAGNSGLPLMNVNPRIELLKQMMQLEQQRGALQLEMDALEQRLTTLQKKLLGSEAAPAKSTPAKRGSSRQRTQRGALTDKIMSALESAGSAGVRVKELGEVLGIKVANIHAWFHSTAKRNPSIVKVDGGHYRLDGSSKSSSAAATSARSKKAPAAPARKKGKAGKPGSLAPKIIKVLEKSGDEGVSIKDIAAKTGSQYRNISIWFATTGKKNASIKKVGPALYTLAKAS